MAPEAKRKGWEVAMEVAGGAYNRINGMLRDRKVTLGELTDLGLGLGQDIIHALDADQLKVLSNHKGEPVLLGDLYAWIKADVVAKGLRVFKVHKLMIGRVK